MNLVKRFRWRRTFGTAAIVSASSLLLATVATASTPGTTSTNERTGNPAADRSIDEMVRANDHPMGSQIAKREGSENQISSAEARRIEPKGIGAGGVEAKASVPGIDVSGWQKNVDWKKQWNAGYRFAYVKATEGTGYKSPYHTQQYNGSYNVGMIRGSYHFALPDRSTGRAQADYFVDRGGAWSGDGKTLPGALDMEYNPYGADCYGKNQSQMAAWIRGFHDRYHERTGRWPVIYTSTSWWNMCVGNAQSFGKTVPLWIARYNSTVGPLPNGWNFHTIWQHSADPIDQNRFNGAYDRLQALAKG
ncbi:GH25 family lysozyme M1 (1,4-beta-N-acetylmuramidase) [Tamaricihabitans halophyticus]|uniref:lysozyme n=1 Tax=Tamaricihabitans halophyticus TaxID=1262583 RepID=A0A4R2QZ12_9PSEU|nr:lysozyme [Tamaricihabitans halophyticus]TCP54318.1 GH25 family lysozyme M1 (1,4-beta-N-acetylmuramidase) [Tamaricihabitans halophyticus]